MLETIFRIAGFWLLFARFAYWIGLSFETERFDKRVFLSQFLEGVFLFGIFIELFQNSVLFAFSTNGIGSFVGFFLICLGVIGSFLAQMQLGYAWTHAVFARIKSKQELVTKGVYRYVRHPIYSGIILSYIGSQLLAGSWLWVSCVFLFIPAYFQAKKEEKGLEKHFGKRYVVYKEKTKWFLPYLW